MNNKTAVNTINTCDLKLGMRYTSPVFFDDGTNMFLAENRPIKQFHLDAIKQWKIQKLVTYGRLIDANNKGDFTTDSRMDEVDEVEELEDLEELHGMEDSGEPYQDESYAANDEPPASNQYSNTLSGVSGCYEEALQNMREVFFANGKKSQSIRTIVDSTADMLLRMVKRDSSGSVSYILNKGSSGKYPASAVNIAVLAAAAAFAMDLPDRKVWLIITSALLHDIYMPSVPPEIVNKKGKLTSSEFEVLKMHTVRGASYLTDTLLLPKDVATAVLQHHEYYGGGGYPEGRSGTDIDIAARIISVCDAFEAMVSEKPYRNALIGYEAVKSLLSKAGKQFDPDVVRCFVKSTGVYPSGTLVLMSNISVARVIESDEDSFFLPVVKIVAKGYGDIETGTIIKLREQRSVFIVRPLSHDEALKFV